MEDRSKVESLKPWEIYFDEFRRRAEPLANLRFDRNAALASAAHDAYQDTADHLSLIENWDHDRTLVVTRAFVAIVKQWIDHGHHDLPALRERLRDWYQRWDRPPAAP